PHRERLGTSLVTRGTGRRAARRSGSLARSMPDRARGFHCGRRVGDDGVPFDRGASRPGEDGSRSVGFSSRGRRASEPEVFASAGGGGGRFSGGVRSAGSFATGGPGGGSGGVARSAT